MADRYSEAFPCSSRTPLLRTGERQCRCFQLLSTGRANPGNRGTRPLLLTSGVSNELEGDWHPYAELAGPRSRCIDLKARSEEHTSELQSHHEIVCGLL